MGFEGCCGLVGNRNYGPTNGMQVRNGSTAVRCRFDDSCPHAFRYERAINSFESYRK